jgi:hypothetical protein
VDVSAGAGTASTDQNPKAPSLLSGFLPAYGLLISPGSSRWLPRSFTPRFDAAYKEEQTNDQIDDSTADVGRYSGNRNDGSRGMQFMQS